MKIIENPTLRLFIGAALISLSPVWVRLSAVSSSTSGFYRVLFGSIALIAILIVTRRQFHLSKRAWWILVLASVFLALDLWFWHRSINYIGPGLSTLLANFQVFFMMIAGVLLLRQMPSRLQIFAVPLALFGLMLIVGIDWRNLPEHYRAGVIYGLLTAVVYAGYLLSLRASRHGSPYRLPVREMIVVSVLTSAILAIAIFAEGESFTIPSNSDLLWLVAYGVLSHCFGWMFIASSLPEVTAVQAGLALLSQPTLSFVWDVLIFDRPMTSVELLGAAIALLAIYLGSRPVSKQV